MCRSAATTRAGWNYSDVVGDAERLFVLRKTTQLHYSTVISAYVPKRRFLYVVHSVPFDGLDESS